MNYPSFEIIKASSDADTLRINEDQLLPESELNHLVDSCGVGIVRQYGNFREKSLFIADAAIMKLYDFHLIMDNENRLVLLPVRKT